jgi:hypothetical protein
MTTDPIGWLQEQLSDLPALLTWAKLDPDLVGPDDAAQMAQTAPLIAATVKDLLARVRAGELAQEPVPAEGDALTSARVSWL